VRREEKDVCVGKASQYLIRGNGAEKPDSLIALRLRFKEGQLLTIADNGQPATRIRDSPESLDNDVKSLASLGPSDRQHLDPLWPIWPRPRRWNNRGVSGKDEWKVLLERSKITRTLRAISQREVDFP
jgi:hypothetical protein